MNIKNEMNLHYQQLLSVGPIVSVSEIGLLSAVMPGTVNDDFTSTDPAPTSEWTDSKKRLCLLNEEKINDDNVILFHPLSESLNRSASEVHNWLRHSVFSVRVVDMLITTMLAYGDVVLAASSGKQLKGIQDKFVKSLGLKKGVPSTFKRDLDKFAEAMLIGVNGDASIDNVFSMYPKRNGEDDDGNTYARYCVVTFPFKRLLESGFKFSSKTNQKVITGIIDDIIPDDYSQGSNSNSPILSSMVKVMMTLDDVFSTARYGFASFVQPHDPLNAMFPHGINIEQVDDVDMMHDKMKKAMGPLTSNMGIANQDIAAAEAAAEQKPYKNERVSARKMVSASALVSRETPPWEAVPAQPAHYAAHAQPAHYGQPAPPVQPAHYNQAAPQAHYGQPAPVASAAAPAHDFARSFAAAHQPAQPAHYNQAAPQAHYGQPAPAAVVRAFR